MDWTGHVDVFGFGAALITMAGLMLRYIIRRSDRLADDYRRLVENHLTHNTAALIDLRNAVQKLTHWLETRH